MKKETKRKEKAADVKRPVEKKGKVEGETGAERADPGEPSRSELLARLATEAALEKKGIEPVLLDVRGESTYTDFILLVSGRSDRHVQAVADGIAEVMKKSEGVRPIGREGQRDGQWALLDFGDVVVHVFYHPMREFYDLEGLWIDAPRIPLEIPPDSRAQVNDLYGA